MSNITEKTLPDTPREATLTDVLEAREKRVSCQQRLLERFRKPVVCFTLNIAGPVKVDEATRYAFRIGRERLTEGLKTMGFDLLASETLVSVAGQEYLAAVNAPAEALKRLCVSLEELDQLGRLFDLDVIGTDGQKLERGAERSCLVCGKPGRGCASRRVHPVDEIRAVTQGIIRAHQTREQTRRVATAAVQSLLDEVCVTPKPGLVDRENNGSHRDMDIFTFTASASALYPYFEACCLAGLQDRALDAETAFRRLQSLGNGGCGRPHTASTPTRARSSPWACCAPPRAARATPVWSPGCTAAPSWPPPTAAAACAARWPTACPAWRPTVCPLCARRGRRAAASTISASRRCSR